MSQAMPKCASLGRGVCELERAENMTDEFNDARSAGLHSSGWFRSAAGHRAMAATAVATSGAARTAPCGVCRANKNAASCDGTSGNAALTAARGTMDAARTGGKGGDWAGADPAGAARLALPAGSDSRAESASPAASAADPAASCGVPGRTGAAGAGGSSRAYKSESDTGSKPTVQLREAS